MLQYKKRMIFIINTIGRYKEEKFKHNVANELKERIEKSWIGFGMMSCRYNSNEIDIKEIVCLIDLFKDDDMKVVKSILKNQYAQNYIWIISNIRKLAICIFIVLI